MQGSSKAGDLFSTSKNNQDGFLQLMHDFLNDDKNLMQLNDAVY